MKNKIAYLLIAKQIPEYGYQTEYFAHIRVINNRMLKTSKPVGIPIKVPHISW